MSLQSPMSDPEIAAVMNDVPEQLEVEKPPAETNGVKGELLKHLQPTPDSNFAADYSDVPSQEESQQRRRHQRGGRKKKTEDLQSVAELQDQYDERFEEQEGRSTASKPKQSSGPFGTGIKTFNLKRAESSGGRAFGLSVENKNRKTKVKPKNRSKPKVKCESCGRRSKTSIGDSGKEIWESDDSSDESQETEEVQKARDEKPPPPQEEPKQKPFAIRLDLNLELEIFLRAKIKGDVTITFLQ